VDVAVQARVGADAAVPLDVAQRADPGVGADVCLLPDGDPMPELDVVADA